MIDIEFIEFYLKKKYHKSISEYFNVSKPVVSIWKNKSFPVSRMDEFIRRECAFNVHELFERIYEKKG